MVRVNADVLGFCFWRQLKRYLLLIVFSAWGGIRTGRSMPVLILDSLLSRTRLGHLGSVVGLFYSSWSMCRFTAYRYLCGRLPGTDLTIRHYYYMCYIKVGVKWLLPQLKQKKERRLWPSRGSEAIQGSYIHKQNSICAYCNLFLHLLY